MKKLFLAAPLLLVAYNCSISTMPDVAVLKKTTEKATQDNDSYKTNANSDQFRIVCPAPCAVFANISVDGQSRTINFNYINQVSGRLIVRLMSTDNTVLLQRFDLGVVALGFHSASVTYPTFPNPSWLVLRLWTSTTTYYEADRAAIINR